MIGSVQGCNRKTPQIGMTLGIYLPVSTVLAVPRLPFLHTVAQVELPFLRDHQSDVRLVYILLPQPGIL